MNAVATVNFRPRSVWLLIKCGILSISTNPPTRGITVVRAEKIKATANVTEIHALLCSPSLFSLSPFHTGKPSMFKPHQMTQQFHYLYKYTLHLT